ncbi:uncharacterized protein V6R79_002821 [Siganus canaliculatus]
MAAPRLALTVFMLLLAVVALTEGMRGSGPKTCCSKFHLRPVPQERVASYTRTSQRCSNPAIVLRTVFGRQLCVKPSATWVKELVSYLDAKPAPGETSNL